MTVKTAVLVATALLTAGVAHAQQRVEPTFPLPIRDFDVYPNPVPIHVAKVQDQDHRVIQVIPNQTYYGCIWDQVDEINRVATLLGKGTTHPRVGVQTEIDAFLSAAKINGFAISFRDYSREYLGAELPESVAVESNYSKNGAHANAAIHVYHRVNVVTSLMQAKDGSLRCSPTRAELIVLAIKPYLPAGTVTAAAREHAPSAQGAGSSSLAR